MPTAREALLDAAHAAVERRPWRVVRMVEVAAAAGVSRQTLYNEFGDKAGLGAALLDRRLTTFLDGFAEELRAAVRPDAGRTAEEALAGAGDRLVRAARADVVVRATLVGCRRGGLPAPPVEPGELVAELRERALRVLLPVVGTGGRSDGAAGTAGDGADAAGRADGASGTDRTSRADGDGATGGAGGSPGADEASGTGGTVGSPGTGGTVGSPGPGAGGASREDSARLAERCETTIRLALSHLVAPAVPAARDADTPGPAGTAPAPARSAAPRRPPGARRPAPPAYAPPAPAAQPARRGSAVGAQSPSRRSRVASSRRSE